jgi:predicted nucleic acid-binding protein
VESNQALHALSGHSVIALDSCVLIYFLEGGPFADPAQAVLEAVRSGKAQAILSTLALLEVQVSPYRKGDEDLADRYFALLQDLPNCRWVPLSYAIADRAAQLRAEHGVTAPDAIHLATALECGATLFVTNDRDLPPVPGLGYYLLGD